MHRISPCLYRTFAALSGLIMAACAGAGGLQIDSAEPPQVGPGQTLRLIGQGFVPATDKVKVGDQEASYTEETAQTLQDDEATAEEDAQPIALNEVAVTVPADLKPGDYFVQVTSEDGKTASIGIQVISAEQAAEIAKKSDASDEEKKTDTPVDTEPSTQTVVVANFSGSTFVPDKFPFYKGADTEKFLSTLTWNIKDSSSLDAVPDYITVGIKGTEGHKYTSGKKQQGSTSFEISQTTTFELRIFRDDKQVDFFQLEVPVLTGSDLPLSVTAINKATNEVGTTLTAADDYKSPSIITIEVEADDRYDEVCVVYPQVAAPTNKFKLKHDALPKDMFNLLESFFISNAYAYQPWTGKIEMKSDHIVNIGNLGDLNFVPAMTGTKECFSAKTKTLTFDQTGNATVEFWGVVDGKEINRSEIVLPFTIQKPSVQITAAFVNDTVGADIELDLDFETGARFALATNANITLSSLSSSPGAAMSLLGAPMNFEFKKEFLNIGMVKTSVCKVTKDHVIHSGPNLPELCQIQELIAKVRTTFAEELNAGNQVYLYDFNQHDVKGKWFAKTQSLGVNKFYGFGLGHNNIVVLSGDTEEIPAPDFSEFCPESSKEEVFEPLKMSAGGHIYGLKGPANNPNNLDVTFQDVSGTAGLVPDVSKGEGAWQGTITGTYTGMHPGVTITGTSFLGTPYSFSCEWGKIKIPEISLTILDPITDKYNFEAKVEAESGPRALTHWKMEQVAGESCGGSDLGTSKEIDYVPTADFPARAETFTISKAGIDCWKARMKVQMIDGSWSTVNWTAPSGTIKDVGSTWTSRNSGGTQTIEFPPLLEFSWERVLGATAPGAPAGKACYYYKEGGSWDDWDGGEWATEGMALEFHASGKNVVSLTKNCHVGSNGGGTLSYPVNQIGDAKGDFTAKRLLVEWRGEEYKVTITCSISATGVAGQSSNGGMGSFSWNCEVP